MTFYWYDYETWGPDPISDRPAQFAGVRTDEQLRVIGEPLVLYCRPTSDYLPVPESCLVHGISPHDLLYGGILPSDFAARIHRELSRSGTCAVGYNSIAFDHEVTRFLFYRNLLDPYAWHYRSNCSRWDVIDLLRAAFALKPDGIAWPSHSDGTPSFRLADIAAANDIKHGAAHDALSDVLTTIEVARMVKKTQPQLFDYYLSLRLRRNVLPLLQRTSVYVSGLLGARNGYTTLISPICRHPTQSNCVIVQDLRRDLVPYLDMSADEIGERLFTKSDELPDGAERPPLLAVRANSCPFVADWEIIDADVAARLNLDVEACLTRRDQMIAVRSSVAEKIAAVYHREWPERDVDEALYDGFIPEVDRRRLEKLIAHGDLSRPQRDNFADRRTGELLFRFRARNAYNTLSLEGARRWHRHCKTKLLSVGQSGCTKLDEYDQQITNLRGRSLDRDAIRVLDDLECYGQGIRSWLESYSHDVAE